MNQREFDVAVVGGGGAGTMAYLRAVLNGNRAVLFTGDADSKRKGRATWVMAVDNIPGMHDLKRPITSTTKTTLAWLKEQPELSEGSEVVPAKVDRLTQDGDEFVLGYERKGEAHSLRARNVVIATGIMDVQPLIQGSIEPIFPFANRGDAIYCVRCDGHQTIGKRLSVIGNSSTAAHIAAMMIERYGHESVDLLTNGEDVEFSPSARELIDGYGMTVHTAPIVAVRGDAKTGLEGFELEGGEFVPSERSIVALGILAYNELLKDVGAELASNGKAVVSEKFESSVPGVFVVGDLADGKKMQIYTGWDMAVDAADEIDRRLRMERRRERLSQTLQ